MLWLVKFKLAIGRRRMWTISSLFGKMISWWSRPFRDCPALTLMQPVCSVYIRCSLCPFVVSFVSVPQDAVQSSYFLCRTDDLRRNLEWARSRTSLRNKGNLGHAPGSKQLRFTRLQLPWLAFAILSSCSPPSVRLRIIIYINMPS